LTPARPLVALRGVTKRYATGTLALNGIDLAIAPGEFVALLGASGCGKSTLLRILAGLSAPSAGSIDWPQATHDASGDPLRDIGFVFQEPTLMPWATVMRNVTLPLELAGVKRSEAEDRAAEWLARVELRGFERAYPRALSGGMKMRVSIARALVTRPRLLLMDEPFAALDEITRFRLNNDLLHLWAEDRFTVVFVTHSVFESVFLAERVVVMAPRPGRIAEEIRIAVDGPRNEAFRTSAAYAEHCRTVSAGLTITIMNADRAASLDAGERPA
jgi:NitT/TauT family transport system ATP-binding protein